jgi:hypothetical protein
MDSKIATYLFGDELLYSVKKAAEVPKEIVAKSAKFNAVVDIQPPKVEKEVIVEHKVQEIHEAQLPPKIEQHELVNEAEFVFKMKTHHLFIFNRLEPEERDFLLKILQALGLSFTKVDLLDIYKMPLVDFKQTIHENVVHTIVFFGEESGKDFLPRLKLTSYTVKSLKNINFLFSDTLKQVSTNEANEKRLLWDALKSIF